MNSTLKQCEHRVNQASKRYYYHIIYLIICPQFTPTNNIPGAAIETLLPPTVLRVINLSRIVKRENRSDCSHFEGLCAFVPQLRECVLQPHVLYPVISLQEKSFVQGLLSLVEKAGTE